MSKSDKTMDARAAAEVEAAPLRESVIVKYIPVIGIKTRLIKVVKTIDDPLQPPKLKFTRIPRAAGRNSPPPVVLQSPPRQATAEDEKNWKVPPCVSLWKNPKGYAIPLDKRHSAVDLEPEISHRVADLAEALYAAEEKSRDEVALRSKIRRESEMREKERREKELRELARIARDELGLIGDELGLRERKRARGESGLRERKRRTSQCEEVSRREGYGLAASAKGELLFDSSLVDAYGDGDGDDEVKTTMKMSEREKPIEFEKEDDDDLFGLDEFLSKFNQ